MRFGRFRDGRIRTSRRAGTGGEHRYFYKSVAPPLPERVFSLRAGVPKAVSGRSGAPNFFRAGTLGTRTARLLSSGLASVGDDDWCIILQVQGSSPTGTCLPVTPECPFPLTAGIAVITALKHWGVLYSARQRFGSALTFGIAATC